MEVLEVTGRVTLREISAISGVVVVCEGGVDSVLKKQLEVSPLGLCLKTSTFYYRI